jgi:hypothetical protein
VGSARARHAVHEDMMRQLQAVHRHHGVRDGDDNKERRGGGWGGLRHSLHKVGGRPPQRLHSQCGIHTVARCSAAVAKAASRPAERWWLRRTSCRSPPGGGRRSGNRACPSTPSPPKSFRSESRSNVRRSGPEPDRPWWRR